MINRTAQNVKQPERFPGFFFSCDHFAAFAAAAGARAANDILVNRIGMNPYLISIERATMETSHPVVGCDSSSQLLPLVGRLTAVR